MAVPPKKIQMIIKCKNQSRFSPVRNIKQTELLTNLGRPNEKRIRNQTTNWQLLRRPNDVPDSLFHVSGEHMQQSSHELVVVERSVELDWEAIGDGAVAYVEPGVGEEIVAGVGFWDLAAFWWMEWVLMKVMVKPWEASLIARWTNGITCPCCG